MALCTFELGNVYTFLKWQQNIVDNYLFKCSFEILKAIFAIAGIYPDVSISLSVKGYVNLLRAQCSYRLFQLQTKALGKSAVLVFVLI